jgi:nitric oxide reductase NorQ protein
MSTHNPTNKQENEMPTTTKTLKAKAPVHPLVHLIPGRWFAENEDGEPSYISRSFDGFSDLDLLAYARSTQQNTLMFGPTGPGKTTCVYAFGAIHKLPVVNVACNGAIDPSTTFVRPVFAADGSVQMVESDVLTVIRKGGILYLDEVNFMPPRVASVLHGLLDDRRIITVAELGNEKIAAHPDLQVIATFNPDYEGTKRLNQAFKNRFAIKMEFNYDREVEEKLVTLTSLLDLAGKLRDAHDAGDIETPVSTNMLMEFERIAWDLNVGYAITNFLAAFASDERGAVSKVIELHDPMIREQMVVWGQEAEDVYNNKKEN